MHLVYQTLLFLIGCLVAATLQADDYDVSTSERVVAFGDVHGAYDDWVALLREVGVVDAANNWSGGRTHLVSLGDLIDRGPGSRQVVELLMKLEGQAEQAGGAVHTVLGNHEVMVMTGDLRYVSGAEFAAFAADETPAERDALFADYRRYNPGGNETQRRLEFDREFPPGYVGLRKAYGSDGKLGRWLKDKPFVIKVNDKVYLHGGISAGVAGGSLKDINEQAAADLHNYLDNLAALEDAGVMPLHVQQDQRLKFLNTRAEEFAAANPGVRPDWFDPLTGLFESQEYFLFDDDSPHWYRGTSLCHPYAESFNTERFLKNVGAAQIVVGHTPTRGEVVERMDGLAIRLDTGMLRSVYRGRASALVSHNGSDYVHYLGMGSQSQPVTEQRELSMQLSGMSDAQLEDFLLFAPIANVEEIGTGVTKPKRVTLDRDGISQDAVFKYEDTHPGIETNSGYNGRRNNQSDRFVYDVAAYKLDRMLDWQMVPVTVLREVDGDEGALGGWVSKSINERDRLKQEQPFNSYCKKNEQYRLRFVFDILIYNEDRNLTNILWTENDYMMKFIDHSLAFRSTEKRPRQYRKVSLEVSDLLRARLSSLNEANTAAELSAYLHPRQIEAILARRDLILNEAVSTDPAGSKGRKKKDEKGKPFWKRD